MAALGPVMYLGNMNPFILMELEHHLSHEQVYAVFDSVMSLLWFKDGYNLMYTFIDWIAPRFLRFTPNFVWFFIQGVFVGFNKVSHMGAK